MLPAFDNVQNRIYLAVLERNNGQQRAEKFIADNIFIGIDRIDYRRGVTQLFGITQTSENDAVAVGIGKG